MAKNETWFSCKTLLSILLLGAGLYAPAVFAIPCDLLVSPGHEWSDRFARVGETVVPQRVDDECGMWTSLDARLGEGSLEMDVAPMPHRLKLSLYFRSDAAVLPSGHHLVIFRASPSAPQWLAAGSPLEIRLTKARSGETFVTVAVTDGPIAKQQTLGPVSSQGATLEIDVTRSSAARARDGAIEVTVDGAGTAKFQTLDLWAHLPTRLEMGVVAVHGSSAGGELFFKPLSIEEELFGNSAAGR